MPRSRISLIVPTRGRPESLARLLASLDRTSADPEGLEVVLVVDADDPSIDSIPTTCIPLRVAVGPPGRTMGQLDNAGYKASTGDHVLLLNDDVLARTVGWDDQVRAILASYPDGIVLVHVNDTLMREHLCTFPLVSRRFCEIAGGLCPEAYQRYRIDDHIEDIFNLLHFLGHRRIVYRSDLVFEHLNAVEQPCGVREYHSEPGILACDAPLFLHLFGQRKEIALRLLQHIDPGRSQQQLEVDRQRLAALDDPFALRIPGRQWGAPPVPTRWQQYVARWRACRARGGVARAVARRLGSVLGLRETFAGPEV